MRESATTTVIARELLRQQPSSRENFCDDNRHRERTSAATTVIARELPRLQPSSQESFCDDNRHREGASATAAIQYFLGNHWAQLPSFEK